MMTLNTSYDPGCLALHLGTMETELRASRSKLHEDIWQNRDTSSSTEILMATGCPLERRYDILKFPELLHNNSQNLVQLQRLPVAFTILEKYARHLLRPPKARSAQWKVIKYTNPIFASKVDVVEGGRFIMHQMGYTLDIGDGVSFPERVEPNPNHLVSLVGDIVLARYEVEAFTRGTHPNMAQVEAYISQTARNELDGLYLSNNLPDVLPTPLPKIKLQKSPPAIPPRELKPVYTPSQGVPQAGAEPLYQAPTSCDICGEKSPKIICHICDSKQLCSSCDEKWHRHPKRLSHNRTTIGPSKPVPQPRSPKHVVTQSWDSSQQSSVMDNSRSPPSPHLPGNNTSKAEIPRVTSPTPSDESYYSTEESGPFPKEENKESGAVMPNLSIFGSDSEQQHGASEVFSSESEAGGDYSASSQQMPPPLPDVFYTEDYSSPKAEAKRELAALEDKIVDMEKSLESLIASSVAFYENPNYLHLTRLKDLLLRQKIELLRKINTGQASGTAVDKSYSPMPPSSFFPSQEQVFYPPPLLTSTGPGGPPERHPVQPPLRRAQPLKPSLSAPMFHRPSPHLIQPSLAQHSSSALHPVHPIVSQPIVQSSTSHTSAGQPFSSNTLPTRKSVTVKEKKGYYTLPYNVTLRNSRKPVQVGTIDPLMHREEAQSQLATVVASEDVPRVPKQRGSVVYSWVCDHCTYVNEAGDNICTMCNKTSDNPKPATKDEGLGEESMTSYNAWSTEHQIISVGSLTRHVHEEAEQVMLEKKEAQKRFSLNQQSTEDVMQNTSNVEIEAQNVKELENKANTLATLARTTSDISSSKCEENVSFSFQESTCDIPERTAMADKWASRTAVAEALEKVNQVQAADQQLTEGKKVITLLRIADRLGFQPDELQIAMEVCGSKKPIDWLKEDWHKLINGVITMATHEGEVSTHNDVGKLTELEARESLKRTGGNVEEAVQDCVQSRKKKFQQLVVAGPFPREAILSSMYKTRGDVDEALTQLQRAQLQPYMDRMWQIPNDSQPEALLMAAANQEHDFVANSVIGHDDFQEKVRDSGIDYERRVRMVLVEGKLQGWVRSKAVIHIFTEGDQKYELQDVIEAVKNCGDVHSSLVYLQQECEICFAEYPMSKIRNFTHCQCKICADCLAQHLELVIKEQFIKNWACPVCQRPDIQQDDQAASDYFTFLNMLLPTVVSKEVQDLFQTKLRDWRLMQDPNFRWCAHCGNGFIFNADQLKMECTSCKQHTCFKCKKPWETQHEGLTCEQFARWKFDNNPENQATGLARHLDENGIVCPGCKMRYALAKGGCMHFKCPQCGHEFCSGCLLPFRRAESCKMFLWCHNQGLHCHHPRNCFFYLRDNEVEELQSLLEINKIEFNKVPPEGQENKKACPVMEQKEEVDRKRDEACGKKVQAGHAGLCQIHYKEYLVNLINKNDLDPVNIMSLEKIINLLNKMEKQLPARGKNESNVQYHKRLVEFLQRRVPLARVDSTGHFLQT